MDSAAVAYSLHVTDISVAAKSHYHKNITETYFFLECDAGASMELDGELVPVQPHTAIVIPPGTWHRAVGKMKVMLIASPKFDPADEWFE